MKHRNTLFTYEKRDDQTWFEWAMMEYYEWRYWCDRTKFANYIYEWKCYFYHRYSTVKSRHLGHTWVDTDNLLECTIIEVMERFNEKEGCQIGLPYVFEPDKSEDWHTDNFFKSEKELFAKLTDVQKEQIVDWYSKNTDKDCTHSDHLVEISGRVTTVRMEIDRICKWFVTYLNDDGTDAYKKSGVDAMITFEEQQEKELLKNVEILLNIRGYCWT